LDTADTSTISGTDLDVSDITPGGSPRVLDSVVWGSGGFVSDGEDTVVQVGSASGTSDDTGLVVSEDGCVSLDGNGDWALGNGSLELSSVVGWDISVTADLELAASGGLAGLVNSLVWVLVLGGETLVLDVLEGAGHETAGASVVSV